MHWACKGGRTDVVARLLDARVDADAPSRRGSRPIHLACEARAPEVVAALLSAGADADEPDLAGITPLHAASAAGCARSVTALLERKVDTEAELTIRGRHELTSEDESTSKRALYLAAEKGHAKAVQLLLEAGADVHALATHTAAGSSSRTSCVWAAVRGGHGRVAEALRAAGGREVALADGN